MRASLSWVNGRMILLQMPSRCHGQLDGKDARVVVQFKNFWTHESY